MRQIFVLLVWLNVFTGVLVAGDQNAKAEDNVDDKGPLNILVLYADDWRHDTLGVAGNPIVKTPTLDQMTRDGMSPLACRSVRSKQRQLLKVLA